MFKIKQTWGQYSVLLKDHCSQWDMVLVPAAWPCFLSALGVLLSCCVACHSRAVHPSECCRAASTKWWISVCISWMREELHEPHGVILHRSPNISSNSVHSVSDLFQQQKQMKVLFVNKFIVVHWCWKYWHVEALPDANQGPSSNEWPACKSHSPYVFQTSALQIPFKCQCEAACLVILVKPPCCSWLFCPCCAETNLLEGFSPITRTKGHQTFYQREMCLSFEV